MFLPEDMVQEKEEEDKEKQLRVKRKIQTKKKGEMGMAKVGFDIVTMRRIKLGELILQFDIKENVHIDIIR